MNRRERDRLLAAAEGYFRFGNQGLARLSLEQLLADGAPSSRAYELLGYVHGNAGDLAEAHRCLTAACRLPGASPEAWYYLGVSHLKRHEPAPAVQAFDKAIALAGPSFEALHDRGTALSQLGRHAAALDSYARALKLRPDSFDLVFNIGKVYDAAKDFGNALAYYDRAIALDSGVADTWAHRGAVKYDLERYAEAIDDWERALAIDPQIEFLRGFLLHARLRLCDWRDWAAARHDLIARVEAGEKACGPLEMLAFSDDEELQSRTARSFASAGFEGVPLPAAFPRTERDRIRVAYFSADFGRHAVSYLTAELFELHDRERFETFGFALNRGGKEDTLRQRLSRAFDHFIEAGDRPDLDVVDEARRLGIDIAVDLGGHTKGSRTGLFRHRVAPVQVNFLGYPGTMGADFIDYIIADEVTIPEASLHAYAEQVVHLPECFQPSDTRRAISAEHRSRREFGLPDDGFVFCCFNNTYKLNPETFASWMRIVAAVEGSCLWLLADSEAVAVNLRSEAVRAGVAADRLVFGGRLPPDEYLARFRAADLFLDTLPFNAGTTANDALFAGLPVLTCAGHSFAARMAASLLHTHGLPELVAASLRDYEATAIGFALDPAGLGKIRDRVDRQRAGGALFDMPRYTRHLEAAYRQMHARRREGLPPVHLRLQDADAAPGR